MIIQEQPAQSATIVYSYLTQITQSTVIEVSQYSQHTYTVIQHSNIANTDTWTLNTMSPPSASLL